MMMETAKIITYGAGIRHEHDARCHHKPGDNLVQAVAQTMTHSMSRRRQRSSIQNKKKKVSYAKIVAQGGGGSRLMAVSLAGVPVDASPLLTTMPTKVPKTCTGKNRN